MPASSSRSAGEAAGSITATCNSTTLRKLLTSWASGPARAARSARSVSSASRSGSRRAHLSFAGEESITRLPRGAVGSGRVRRREPPQPLEVDFAPQRPPITPQPPCRLLVTAALKVYESKVAALQVLGRQLPLRD